MADDPNKDPKSVKEKIKDFVGEVKGSDKTRKGVRFLGEYRLEFFSGALMILGLIFSFYYIHLGGALVGLGVGMGFFGEIESYFAQLRGFYSAQGIFKTLMLIGTVLYFLLSIPVFLVCCVIGFGVIYLIRYKGKKPTP